MNDAHSRERHFYLFYFYVTLNKLQNQFLMLTVFLFANKIMCTYKDGNRTKIDVIIIGSVKLMCHLFVVLKCSFILH